MRLANCCGPANAEMIQLDSVEVDEPMCIIIEQSRVLQVIQNIDEYGGAPGMGLYPIEHDLTTKHAAFAPAFAKEVIQSSTKIAVTTRSSGYAVPTQRNLVSVNRSAKRRWLSLEGAKEAYRVLLAKSKELGIHTVNERARLRAVG